jgi:hypothetical protein
MAVIHNATLVPGKLELLQAWLPARSWWPGRDGAAIERLGTFRFDDPAGEVGVETFLLGVEGRVIQVPLTYRGAPLDGAETALLGTMQHSVLGKRWVCDGCADPVYVQTLAVAILSGGREAPLDVHANGAVKRVPSPTKVAGSGTPGSDVPVISTVTCASDAHATTVNAGPAEFVVRRLVEAGAAVTGCPSLTGTWPGQDEPVVLAYRV